MKILCLCVLLSLFAGCSKITNLTTTNTAETEQTGDPVYDSQTEMRVLLPWTWLI